jgi:hypothetical protein
VGGGGAHATVPLAIFEHYESTQFRFVKAMERTGIEPVTSGLQSPQQELSCARPVLAP